MKIYCVSIGEKYGPQFEKYLENKLGKINWIREQIAPNVPLQWNKMYPMSLKDTEPVCVIDLDIVFISKGLRLIKSINSTSIPSATN